MARVDVQRRETQVPIPRRSSRGWPSMFMADPFGGSPFGMVRRLAEELDREFGRWPALSEGAESAWPAVDVYEEDSTLNVLADLPGVRPEDLKVQVTEAGVILDGERKHNHEERGETSYRSEWAYGAFHRMIPLPDGADTEKAKAEYHDGELKIVIPIPEAKKRRRQIPVSIH